MVNVRVLVSMVCIGCVGMSFGMVRVQRPLRSSSALNMIQRTLHSSNTSTVKSAQPNKSSGRKECSGGVCLRQHNGMHRMLLRAELANARQRKTDNEKSKLPCDQEKYINLALRAINEIDTHTAAIDCRKCVKTKPETKDDHWQGTGLL